MNKITKSLIIILFMIISLPMTHLSAQVSTWDGTWEPWTHGTGTEDDPFLIENAQQLAYLAYRVNNGLDAGGGHVSNHDYHYKLMVDIDLNGSEDFQWTPIGYWNSDTDYQCFGGFFDGGEHAVSELYINSSANRASFFGFVDGATIENFGVNGGSITTTGMYAGGIIGVAEGISVISNCYNTGIVSSPSSNTYTSSFSGGIIGNARTINITNCYNTGATSSSCSYHSYDNIYSGGIIGYAVTASITNCYNIGTVSSFNCSYSYIGGIVGIKSHGTVINSFYLTTCGGGNSHGGQSMSADAMQTQEFVETLNNGLCAWEYDLNNTNSGYPVLTMVLIMATTSYATDITQSHATLNGTIEVENISIQSQGFKYKKTTDSDYQTVTVSGSGTISQTISNLTPNTQYQFRTFCTPNDCGTTYGEEKTFTTLPISVTTNNASEITQTHATLNGNLNIGDANISAQGFEYKKTSEETWQTISATGSGDISTILSDLTQNTQYRFRTFCTPQGCDPVYGQEKTFNTLSIIATTNDASNITQTHATLNGALNFGDANIASQGFEYKKTSDNIWQTVNVSGNGDISTALSDLTFNTQYCFRTFCIPEGCDPVYGQEKTFNTLPISVTTNYASNITQTHATLNGTLNIGDANISSQGFEYKKTTDPEYERAIVVENGDISKTLSGLQPGTQYQYHSFCTLDNWPNDDEVIYGNERYFNTTGVFMSTYPATNLTESSVTLNGFLDIGDANSSDKGFKYWPSDDIQNITTVNVTNTGNISETINNLEQNTYIYRVFVNINGELYQGDIKEFEISWLNSDTIYINNAEKLRWIAEQCNSGTTFEGKYIKLVNNIVLPLNVPNNMISVGSYPDHPFKGTFDGNGMLISNLYIDQPNTPYQGFFGYTLNANLYNVGLVNISASGRNYTGGMVAYAENTHLRDCYVNGGTLYALSYCGGLVGYQEQGTNSIISGCYNTCTVSGNHYVGGLLGYSNYGTVRNSYVAAPVTGQGNGVGGIIGGANEVLMYNCYFNTEITGQTEAIGENNFKGGEGLTSAQMRDPQFVATLNQGLVSPVWEADLDNDPINNGFPILNWQIINTGINEIDDISNHITFYPNPATDLITIKMDNESVNFKQIKVFDISGREVMAKNASGQQQNLSVSGLPKGIYFVRVITTDNNVANVKLVVQ